MHIITAVKRPKSINRGKARWRLLVPNVRLSPNADGTYDIFLEYSKADVEFAKDFDLKRNLSENAKKLSEVVSY